MCVCVCAKEWYHQCVCAKEWYHQCVCAKEGYHQCVCAKEWYHQQCVCAKEGYHQHCVCAKECTVNNECKPRQDGRVFRSRPLFRFRIGSNGIIRILL